MVIVTERDKKILGMLAVYGCVLKDYIYDVYMDKENNKGKSYRYDRLQKLKRENYLIYKKGTYSLGTNGIKYLLDNQQNVNYKYIKEEQRNRLAEIHDIIYKLSPYIEIENRGNIYADTTYQNKADYIRRYIGRFRNNHGEYIYVYHIPKGMTVSRLKLIFNEIQGRTKKALLLVDDLQEIKRYKSIGEKNNISNDSQTEILMLARPQYYQYLQYYADGTLDDSNLADSIEGWEIDDRRLYINGTRAINVSSSDLVIERFLKAYDQTTSNDFYIVCLKWQQKMFEKEYPNRKVLAIDIEAE